MPEPKLVNNDCAFFVRTAAVNIGDADLPGVIHRRPYLPNYGEKLPRLQLERAYQSAFCPNDKRNSQGANYFAGKPSANCGAIRLTGRSFTCSAVPFIVIASS